MEGEAIRARAWHGGNCLLWPRMGHTTFNIIITLTLYKYKYKYKYKYLALCDQEWVTPPLIPLSWLIWKSRKFKVKPLSSVPQHILGYHLKTYCLCFKLFSFLIEMTSEEKSVSGWVCYQGGLWRHLKIHILSPSRHLKNYQGIPLAAS